MALVKKSKIIGDPPVAQFLFGSPRMAIVWLLVRVYVGYAWLDAGLHKIQDPAWMQTGEAIKGFWTRVVAIPDAPARPAITYDWYRAFLEFLLVNEAHVFMGQLIAIGEFLVGVALIAGIFTGFAALAGGFMNMNFLLAGSASTNPVLLILAIGLVMAWKVAGYIGVDHFLLPLLGTPWRPQVPQASAMVPATRPAAS